MRDPAAAPSAPVPAPPGPRLPVWAFVVLFWLLLSMIYASQVMLMTPRPAERVIRTQLTWQSIYYLAWAPFTHIRGRLHMQLLIYAAIVGTGQAFGFYNQYREGQLAAARLEAQLAAARLDSLRTQLQPHFLFNSLHGIASLARAGDTAGVVRLISAFSDLLRHLLNSQASHHSLRQELELVDRYLDIQRVRFGDRLRATIDAPADAAAARVPMLIVQPLVENSLRHGFASRIEPGRVAVRGRRVGAALVIEVEDDGVGLPAGWRQDNAAGTGLRNVASRLRGEYGDAQELRVEPAAAGGVRVIVRLPYTQA